jgi:hypothetical protein
MNGIEFHEMRCVFLKIYMWKDTIFQFCFHFMLIMQSDKKNSASRQLLVIPSDSGTRLIAFVGQTLISYPRCSNVFSDKKVRIKIFLLHCWYGVT